MTIEWRPPFASHVKGTYEPRRWDPVLAKHDPQVVDLLCEECRDTHRVVCEQGRPRERIATFARLHLHGDALAKVSLKP
jgi:hypothetical protein